jgi:hypothetical protein
LPSSAQHLDQAHHDEVFYQSLDRGSFADWIVIGIFYTAVHYVEALLATKNIHSGNHGQRDGNVGNHLAGSYKDFHHLKFKSERARYYCEIISSSDVEKCETKISSIKANIQRLLS